MDYKRQIKFSYFRVCLFTKVDGKDQRKDFDLADWLAYVHSNNLFHRNIELSDTKVNFDGLYHYLDEDIYVFRVYKLRDNNVPSIVKEGSSAEPIELEDDEYIGEDMTVLYDWKNSICMVQQNRMSVGTSRLAEWIGKQSNLDSSMNVAFVPISDQFTMRKLKNKYVRSIDFSFANMEAEDGNGPLGRIISSIGRYNGLNAKITISVGRAKDAQLNPQTAMELIQDIQNNPGMIGSAKAKLRGISDDDKARTELVDIFETSSHDYIEFSIKAKKPLDFNEARMKMYSTYMQRREELVKLCKR